MPPPSLLHDLSHQYSVVALLHKGPERYVLVSHRHMVCRVDEVMKLRTNGFEQLGFLLLRHLFHRLNFTQSQIAMHGC